MTAANVRYIQSDIESPRPTDRPGRSRGFDVIRVGWLPGEGWFCTCGVRACGHVEAVREVAR